VFEAVEEMRNGLCSGGERSTPGTGDLKGIAGTPG